MTDTITVKELTYRHRHYSIKGLPPSHEGWISLRYMPTYASYRVTYSPPRPVFFSADWVRLRNTCHTECDALTLEDAVKIIRDLTFTQNRYFGHPNLPKTPLNPKSTQMNPSQSQASDPEVVNVNVVSRQ